MPIPKAGAASFNPTPAIKRSDALAIGVSGPVPAGHGFADLALNFTRPAARA